jgi:RNA polymerase sigma factor (sigma-70 family)
MNNNQEQVIISAIRSGEHEQYRFLVERYSRGLIQHLYNLMHDNQLAEDTAQEAFIRAFNKLSQYNEAYAFSTWLYKIADNIALRTLSQTRPTIDIDSLAELLPDEKSSVGELVDREFTQQAVRSALQQLPLAYQQVVALYYWDECSYQEIAEIIDRPIGTVRTLLYRAKEQLRKELYGQV